MKRLIVETEKLTENINIIKDLANKRNTKIIAVVKGNGYGLGLINYTNFLIQNGIDYIAVATKEEGLALRESGVKEDIIILSSTRVKEDLEELIKNNITLSVGSKECASIVNELSKKYDNIKVHLKIDTGFGRYGIIHDNSEEILESINLLSNTQIEGIYSHFSCSYYKNSKSSLEQYDRFMKVINMLEFNNIIIKMKHISNSSAFLNFENMGLNAVRLGSAFLGRVDAEVKINLNKIAYIESNVVEIKNVPSEFNIGYADVYRTKRPAKLAIIQFGYKDGFSVGTKTDTFRFKDKFGNLIRAFKRFIKREGLYVTINEKKCKILGTVGMNHITVEVTDLEVTVGDIVKIEVNPLYIDEQIKREYK